MTVSEEDFAILRAAEGTWKQKTTIAGGVAPKKTLAELP